MLAQSLCSTEEVAQRAAISELVGISSGERGMATTVPATNIIETHVVPSVPLLQMFLEECHTVLE
ncbi:MAG: hypothetical protein HZA83_03275, partial [Thaumarchaeota archaeon]|nr:hypothetical protein [Nitrososphaerota archaeon]